MIIIMKNCRFTFLLFLLNLMILSSCSKSEFGKCKDVVDYSDRVIYENYANFTFTNFGCVSTQNFEFQIGCDTVAMVKGNRLVLKEQNAEHKLYELVTPGTWGDLTHTLDLFNCDNAFVYTISNKYGGPEIWNSKREYNQCPNLTGPMYCHTGPSSKFCYTSLERGLKRQLSTSNTYSVLTDNANQTIEVIFDSQMSSQFSITIPTDAGLQILSGDYWIGTVPSGDQPILDCFYYDYDHSVGFESFSSGHLNIDTDGADYIFSWRIEGCNKSVWTGYVKGPL